MSWGFERDEWHSLAQISDPLAIWSTSGPNREGVIAIVAQITGESSLLKMWCYFASMRAFFKTAISFA